jgi:hypothetical protein
MLWSFSRNSFVNDDSNEDLSPKTSLYMSYFLAVKLFPADV